MGARDEEAGRLAAVGGRVLVGEDIAVFGGVLEVEQGGVAADHVLERGVVGDPAVQRFALDLHVRPGPGQPVQELRAGPCWHGACPRLSPNASAEFTAERNTCQRRARGGCLVPWRTGEPQVDGGMGHLPARAQELDHRHHAGGGLARGRLRGLAWGAVAAVFAGVLPTVFINRGIRDGRWADRNVGAKRPRLIVLSFIIASVAVGLALMVGLGAPERAVRVLRVHARQHRGAGGDHHGVEDLHPLRGRGRLGDDPGAAVRRLAGARRTCWSR